MTKKILMGCSNYWGSPFQVGSHHIARSFAKLGWKVAFISDPISPFHLLEKNNPSLNERFKYYKNGFREIDKNILAYVPSTLMPPHNKPLLRTEYVHKNWHQWTFPGLKNLLKEVGFDKVDLLYLDNPIHSGLLDIAQYQKSVLRVADLMSGFSKYTTSMGALEKRVAQRVDLVVYTANSLERHVNSLGPRRSLSFPNGVNIENFNNLNSSEPEDIRHIPHPRAIYVGAMHEWFDFDLINEAAVSLPYISFILIGPENLAINRLAKASNIFLMGSRNYSLIPQYLKFSDIGIIPFNVVKHKNLIDHVNPLKLLEYLASGLPVLSIKWDELKRYDGIVNLVDRDKFVSSINEVLQNKNKILLSERKEFANKFDWLTLSKNLISEIFDQNQVNSS